jgi:DNA-binding NtrC family response regulator
MTRVLMMNVDEAVRRDLLAFLPLPRYEVVEASSAGEAMRRLESRDIEVVVAPARLPEGDAVEALAPARDADPALSVVVISGALDAPFASQMPPAGFDVVAKPLRHESLRSAVDRAAESGRLRRENESLKDQLRELQATDTGGDGNGHGEAPTAESHGNGNGRAFREWIASLPESFDLRSLQADVEREIVKRALAASAGVAAQAARKLGLSRSDLAYKLRRLGIVRDPS